MTREDMKKYVEGQVKWYKEQIDWDNKMLEYANKDIKRIREEDKRVVEYVWSKGVVTKDEYVLFIKGFESVDMEKAKKERARYYARRKKDTINLKHYEIELKRYADIKEG